MMGLLQRVRQARVEVAGEVVGQIGPGLLALVCAEQGDGEAEAGHDQRLAHGAGDFVDGRLARHANGHQRMVDAPHRAKQPDKRCC